MKKIMLCSLCLLFCVFYSSGIYAADFVDEGDMQNRATLIGDSGKVVQLNPVEVSEPRPVMTTRSAKGEEIMYVKEAVYQVRPRDFGNAGSMQDIKWDKTGGVKAWVKIYYGTSNGGILLKAVEVNWRKENASLSLSNATVSALCRGVNYYNGQPVKQAKTWNVSPSKIKKNTGFTTPVNSNAGAWVGGKSNVKIKRGGSTWELNLPVNVYMG